MKVVVYTIELNPVHVIDQDGEQQRNGVTMTLPASLVLMYDFAYKQFIAEREKLMSFIEERKLKGEHI